ncbi:hypothetical protein [Brevibacillus formosus]|uniref:hypothetical protein n=1 Tax=Brevibacillus formosus TaxID=54913 RepID=UPI003F1B9124
MFYTKIKINDEVEIQLPFFEDSVFTQCANCDKELFVDNELEVGREQNKKVHLLSSWRDQKMNS